MFRFIFKNAMTKKSKLILTALTIIISCTVGLLAINVSNQVNDGIIELSGGYDLVIGPAGSESQLAFSSMFFTDDTLGTIDYEHYENLLKDKRVNQAIPFAQADSYAGHKVVGTVPQFLINADIKIKGENFDEPFEAVVGYNVAKEKGLSIGDKMITSHGSSGMAHEHTSNPYVIVGILEKTNTNYDNVVFAEISSVWLAHSSGKEHNEHTEDCEDGCEEEHHHTGGLTAILVKSKNPTNQNQLLNEYKKINGLQAITPTVVLRNALESVDLSKQIVYALCGIIFAMSIMLLFIITLLSAQDLRNDIKLMRLLGISSGKIQLIFMLQTAMCSIIALLIAFGSSKFGLTFVNGISTGYGLVINPMKTYNIEFAMIGIMFIVTLIPTFIYIAKLFRKDITKI